MAQITCKDLSFAYDGHTVLSGINFSIDAGSYLCIVGENGSGKSTLMKVLLGLKKPASGSITLGDGLKQTEIGYLPQQTQLQRDFPASVYEVVLSGRLNSMGGRMFYNAEDKKAAQENMERLGMRISKTAATWSFPAVSSSVCCLLGQCAQQRSCFCSTSPSPVLTPWRQMRCTTLLSLLTSATARASS